MSHQGPMGAERSKRFNYTKGQALHRNQAVCVTDNCLHVFDDFSHRLHLPAGSCVIRSRSFCFVAS
jgi:hypothetical protein